MHATVGDRVRIHGRTVGAAERVGEVIEVRGSEESPLLVVRYDDGQRPSSRPEATARSCTRDDGLTARAGRGVGRFVVVVD